jgi:anthranilate/para-aminobenzoate synthase component II
MIVIVFIFQFPIEEELEVLAIGQGLIVLSPGPEVPLSASQCRGAQAS